MIIKFLVPLVVVTQIAFAYNITDDVKGLQDFTLALFKSEYNKTENAVLSPFSIRVLLSILYQNMTGTTETEFCEKLFFGDKASTIKTQEELYKSLWANPSLELASNIHLTGGSVSNSDFFIVVNSSESNIGRVNINKQAQVAEQMNHFVEEKTNGLIKNFVARDSITPITATFLIKTLYFKANWNSQFSADGVKLMNFTNHRGETKMISFLHLVGSFGFADLASIDAAMISLPYEDHTNIELLVVLPHSGSSIESVLDKFTTDTLYEFHNSSCKTGMYYYMPAFETESSLDVKDALQKYGINSIFNNTENLLQQMVVEAKQKTKIIVNTEGTESANTGDTPVKVIPDKIWSSVHVDRPFFYMVLSKDNKIPLFVGHFSDE